MRGAFRLRLIAVGVFATLVVARLQSQGGLRRVSDLSIEVKPLRARVLVQESLPVTTILTNRGNAVATLPSADGPSPFTYELRPAQGNQPTRIVSERLAIEATSPGTPPIEPPIPMNVAPGGSVVRKDDLAAMAVPPFLPGSYSITGSTNNPSPAGPSSPARVEVAPPRVIAAIAALGPNYDRRVAFANAEQDGTFGILSLVGDAAHQGAVVFSRLITQERLSKPDSIAVSVPADNDVRTQWVAWTSSGTLFSSRDWNAQETQRVILRTALPDARGQLVSPGYFFSDDTGLFIVLEGSVVHAFRLNATTLTLAWSAKLGASPERARIRYAGGGKGEGVVQVLTVSNGNGQRRLLLQAWNAKDGRQVVASTTLAELRAPVAAWFLPVTGKGRGHQLRTIIGPNPDGTFSCETYVLEKNTAKVPAQKIPPLGEPATQFAVTALGNGNVVVAARTNSGHLMSLRLPGSSWRLVTDRVADGRIDLYSNYDRAWIEWLDQSLGFRRAGPLAE
jgi:hypothetical protein